MMTFPGTVRSGVYNLLPVKGTPRPGLFHAHRTDYGDFT